MLSLTTAIFADFYQNLLAKGIEPPIEGGHIYVGGTTFSSNFPLAGSPYRPPLNGSSPSTFIAELSGDGKTLIWSDVFIGTIDAAGQHVLGGTSLRTFWRPALPPETTTTR